MACAAMGERLHQIGAAVPLGIMAWVGTKRRAVEEQKISSQPWRDGR